MTAIPRSRWQERTNSRKLPSDHTHTMACAAPTQSNFHKKCTDKTIWIGLYLYECMWLSIWIMCRVLVTCVHKDRIRYDAVRVKWCMMFLVLHVHRLPGSSVLWTFFLNSWWASTNWSTAHCRSKTNRFLHRLLPDYSSLAKDSHMILANYKAGS